MADHGDRLVRAYDRVDKAPQVVAMRVKAVGVRAWIFELIGIAHADQVGRQAAAASGDLRHDIAPQIGRGRVAVQEQVHRFADAKLAIGHTLATDAGELLGPGLEAVWRAHNASINRAG
jgi:hypothetical protein